ncbi:hypothetical protein BDV59DRAFT_167367 [Aspergillus ambiguus]|uniref:uncharacterized protein n=1 Tax=Aspergillus ambiguus TaxID=176160 RepID=UPI003CCD38E5
MVPMPSGRTLGLASALSVAVLILVFFRYPPEFHSTPLSASSASSSPSPSSTTPSTTSPTSTPTSYSSNPADNPNCQDFPDISHVQVVVKTGSNILYDKLPTQLLTTLQCHRDLLLLADTEQDLGPYHVYDVLANVNETIKSTHPDFDYYRTLQQYQNDGLDLRLLRETSHKSAWNLDKYKFIHMLAQAWTRRPGRDWYVFVEADTYLVTRNLVLWLDRMDPSQPLYLGSAAHYNSDLFAHGGSGIVISRGAMSQLLDDDPGLTERYDQHMPSEYYGDYVLMKALREKGITLQNIWPMMQGEKQNSLPFGPGPDTGVRHWCQPLVTMHGVTPGDVSAMWSFEQRRERSKEPLLMSEVYHYFMGRDLPAERDDWYNLSDDLFFRAPNVQGPRQMSPDEMTATEKDAYLSAEHCARACEDHPRCFQYAYDIIDRTCGFSFSYRLGGRQLSPKDEHRYKSGWIREKIEKDYAENTCDGPQWVEHH